MTATQAGPIDRTETADEYGRREKCFRNFSRAPFCFQSYIPYLQSTTQPTEGDGLVAQPGLRAVALPQPNAIGDDSLGDEHDQEYRLEMLLQDLPLENPPLLAGLSFVNELLVHMEPWDLGSRPEQDVQQLLQEVSAKRCCNPFDQWLPLSSIHADRDEGLPFPPNTDRLLSLLHRELEREKMALSEGASLLEQEASEFSLMTQDWTFLAAYTGPERSCYSYPEPITPPLSPISEGSSPFIPNNDSTMIDLVSEPSSPIDQGVQLLQNSVRDGRLDSEPPMPSDLTSSSPRGLPGCVRGRQSSLQDARVDVPIVLTSSDTPCEQDVLENARLPSLAVGEDLDHLPGEQTYFEEAFMALLDDRCTYANNLTEQERLNPSDSIARVPVPVLDFEIAQPDWTTHCSSPRSHFIWLKSSLQTAFNIPVFPRDPRADSALKWTPVPQRSGGVVLNDELGLLSECRHYLTLDALPTLSSASFVSIGSGMTVLELSEDEEIDDLLPLPDNPMSHVPLNTEREQKNTTPSRTGSIQVESSYFKNQDWSSLLRPLRRKAIDDSMSVLPKPRDTSATSKLLSGFMELRAAKKPRLRTSTASSPQLANPKTVLLPRSRTGASAETSMQPSPPCEPIRERVPAVAPEAEIPAEKGAFIVSLSLGRSMLRQLETLWPAENLIDMDYSRHNTMTLPPGGVQPKETISPLTFEADISLSPGVGVIVTTLLKVKQRPLPGSKAQPSLRARTQEVSRKYEMLIVLVSESNPGGEFAGTLAPSDVAAYADFVGFAVALEADVNVHLVPGVEGTLARWILSLMCRYSHQSAALKRFLSAEETSWEVFLRRAGMNVVAAKVLSRVLFEQAGASGLARFLVMSVPERISAYGRLLGAEDMLRKVGEVLDQRWE